MVAVSAVIPFRLQEPVYRLITGSLKHIGKAVNLVISLPEVYAGPGSSLLLCDAVAGTDVKRLLLVTDAMLVKLGLVEPLVKRLQEAGVEVSVFDGVLPDPTVEQCEQALAVLRREHCEAVLAMGGGSVMDCAKIIAACATNNKPIWGMTGFFKVSKAPLPIYCVPTTAGTGSEVSIGAVVSDPVKKQKLPIIDPKMAPRMAALDGRLMTGLPPGVTAATGMDALTHAVESYLSRIAIAETDQMALEAVKLIMRHLPRVMENGKDEEARQMMSWAAYRAGLAFNRAGLGYVHGIAHNFGAYYHTPHGQANAIVLPFILEYSAPACIDRLADLARVSGLEQGDESDEVLAGKFIARIRELKRELGIPETLDALRSEDIPAIAKAALQEAHFSYAVPRYMDQKTCEGLLRQMQA
ncbi:MAG: iron-containing alcohol dehydrogenase [Oleiphilaceae bacterium]|nr:iron-containing alcohol dehydrogenase [Oleiphilaceae bacterium]